MDAILRGKAEELAKEIAVSIFKSTTIRRGFWCIPHLQPNERRRVFRKEDDLPGMGFIPASRYGQAAVGVAEPFALCRSPLCVRRFQRRVKSVPRKTVCFSRQSLSG
jgi:hypothetical protein